MDTRLTPSPPMAPTRPENGTAGQADASHWYTLAGVVLLGGSAFGAISLAIDTAPASVVVAARLWIATLVLSLYAKTTGRPWLPFRNPDGGWNSAWGYAAAIGVIGYAIPMYLFPFAQQTISSLLAGIYMAFMPIATVFLAAIFADEPLTWRKLVGFAGGTLGVMTLIGPGALTNLLSADVIAQGALILATTGYAVASVIMRRAPKVPSRSFAAAILFCAALVVTPFAIADSFTAGPISAASWTAIVYLGVLPTGIASIMLIHLIRGPGAGFLAMGNYLTPLVAILIGVTFFGEVLAWRYLLGLGIILTGLSIAQPGPAKRLWRRIRAISPAGSPSPGDK